jgi:hypothetical protein
MSKWRPVTWVLILVVLAFNLIMLLGFFSLRAERRDCPEGWAGESCWEAQVVPAALADALPRWWVVGDVILGALWVTLGVGWIARRVLGDGGPAEEGRTWRVAEPGAGLKDHTLSEQAVAHLATGTTVIETGRVGKHVLVTTPDGLSGWVAVDRLQPLPDAGSVEGGGDG